MKTEVEVKKEAELKAGLLSKAKEVLNKRELNYFRMMFGQYLVMMLKGRPGTWKSAILKSIADKLNMEFIDLRLPTMDEVDLGAYPVVVQDKGLAVIKMGIPEWAMLTQNTGKNFLIVFEELNRTSVAVRNAALGLLLERRIGPNFVFGNNVYMAATGNLGADDGTDVEEFDAALKSRLIPVTHHAELVEWLDSFAETFRDKDGNVTKKGNIHPDIVEFLKADPTQFYPEAKESGGNNNTDVICNPRTWTALSTAICKNFGDESKVDEYGDFVRQCGANYIGSRVLQFLKFVEENKSVTLDDVIKGKVKDITKIKRDNRAEIMRQFEIFDPNPLNDAQFKRLVEFLKSADHDLFTGSLLQFGNNRIVAIGNGTAGPREREMAKIFKKEYDYLAKEDSYDKKDQPKA